MDNHSEELGDTQVFMINLIGTEEGIPDLTESSQVPVLQDTATDRIATCFGASKWYIYVVDKTGHPRFVHYKLNLDTERERLLAEVALLTGEDK